MTNPGEPTLVEVWAPWCSECRAMEPILAAAAARHPEVAVVRLDAARNTQQVLDLGVRGTPTLIGYWAGQEIYRSTGRKTATDLDGIFAALSAGAPVPRGGRAETALTLGAGVALAGLGLVSGPTWALVAIGAVICALGSVRAMRLGP